MKLDACRQKYNSKQRQMMDSVPSMDDEKALHVLSKRYDNVKAEYGEAMADLADLKSSLLAELGPDAIDWVYTALDNEIKAANTRRPLRTAFAPECGVSASEGTLLLTVQDQLTIEVGRGLWGGEDLGQEG